MTKAIIIDDEISQRQVIKNLLTTKFKSINIIAEAENVEKGIEVLKQNKPDLVFLDVELTDGTSFDILKNLSKIDFKIIFITGYKDFAIQAFKFSAIDYILKPVNSIEFENAVNRAISEINNQNQTIKLDALFANFQNIAHETKKIVLKTQESLHLVNVQNIIRCQSDNSYITFYINDGKKILVIGSLKDYEEILEPSGFFRAHQSHLINLNCITRFDKREGGCVVLSDNSQIPISQRKRQHFFEVFESLGR
jgi:two-component system LytT family response regulator